MLHYSKHVETQGSRHNVIVGVAPQPTQVFDGFDYLGGFLHDCILFTIEE